MFKNLLVECNLCKYRIYQNICIFININKYQTCRSKVICYLFWVIARPVVLLEHRMVCNIVLNKYIYHQ